MIKRNTVDQAVSKVAQFYYKQGDFEAAKQTSISLLNSDDPRVAIRAAELIQKMQMEALKYEEPPKQRMELEGGINITISADNGDGEQIDI